MYREEQESTLVTYQRMLRNLDEKHLKMVAQMNIKDCSMQAHELNLMNIEGGYFDDLDEYVYLPAEIASQLTHNEVQNLEVFEKKT